MIVVSHDRYFLDRVTNRTLELFHGTVDSYTGNFSAYWRKRPSGCWSQRRTYEKQQIEIEKTKDFIRRNHYGQKHAAGRRPPQEARPHRAGRRRRARSPRRRWAFRRPRAAATSWSAPKALAKAFERPLFADVERATSSAASAGACLGPNGCGKTTLLRCLLGLRAARRRPGHISARA